MTGKYQQGPWEVERVGWAGSASDPLHYAIHAMAFGRSVVVADTLNCSCIFSPEDQEANAILLAAAPDMLAALKRMEDAAAFYGHFSESLCAQVNSAIAKAEGKP